MVMTFEERPGDYDGDLYDGGGAPLTDHHAEAALVGYLLHKPQSINDVATLMQGGDLHDPFLRRIFELMIRAVEIDTPITIETLVAGMGGEKSCGIFIARLMADADLHIDIEQTADYLSQIGERRMTGAADDVGFDPDGPMHSKFGAQFWEDIGNAGAAAYYGWLVEYLIPFGEITLVFGDPGSGKSFAMFYIAMCIARNLKFNDYNVEPGLVIYIAAEAGKGFAKRKIAYQMHYGLDPGDPLPFVLLTKRPDFFHDDQDLNELIEEIKRIKRRFSVPLVGIFIDTLSAIAPGMNEIASADVSMVRKRLVTLQDIFRAAVCLVHHKPKQGEGPRGHGSLTGDFETTIEFAQRNERFRATVKKQREDRSGRFWEFTLPVLEVGKNKWGNAETSCVMQLCGGTAPKPATAAKENHKATPTEMEFLRALWDSIIDHGEQPPMALPHSINKVVNYVHVRALMKQRTIPDDTDENADGRFRVAYMRAAKRLRDVGVIGVLGNYFWYTGKTVEGGSE